MKLKCEDTIPHHDGTTLDIIIEERSGEPFLSVKNVVMDTYLSLTSEELEHLVDLNNKFKKCLKGKNDE